MVKGTFYDPEGYGWSLVSRNIVSTPQHGSPDTTEGLAAAVRFYRTPDQIAAALIRIRERVENHDVPPGSMGFVIRYPS